MRRESSVTCLMDQEGLRFCSVKKAGFGRRVGDKKESVQTSSMSRKEKNCAEAFHFTCTRANGGRRHDRAENVETPWRLAHRLLARHPHSDGVENVWNDEGQTTEGVVTTVGSGHARLGRVRVGTRAAVGQMPWLWRVPKLR